MNTIDTRHGLVIPICIAENAEGQMELVLELIE